MGPHSKCLGNEEILRMVVIERIGQAMFQIGRLWKAARWATKETGSLSRAVDFEMKENQQ